MDEAQKNVREAESSARKLPASKRDDLKFKSGAEWTGNAAGRPKGSRNKLGEEFLKDLLADWKEHGAATIEKVRVERPHEYLRVTASILPKELNVNVSEFDDLTDEQLARQLRYIAAQLAAAGVGIGEGTSQEEATQPAARLQTLQ